MKTHIFKIWRPTQPTVPPVEKYYLSDWVHTGRRAGLTTVRSVEAVKETISRLFVRYASRQMPLVLAVYIYLMFQSVNKVHTAHHLSTAEANS
jgi:hypothetical protein